MQKGKRGSHGEVDEETGIGDRHRKQRSWVEPMVKVKGDEVEYQGRLEGDEVWCEQTNTQLRGA